MLRGAELGSKDACATLGYVYNHGMFCLEKDLGKGKHYLELAAIKGSVEARYTLGRGENTERTISRGVKHFMIGARAGDAACLEAVKRGFTMGYVTKNEYEQTLRAYQKSIDEVKSEQRDRARAVHTRANDEDLFKEPPPRGDCPICDLPLPSGQGQTYLVCCGTTICGGCVYAMDLENPGHDSCELCDRSICRSENEHIKRLKQRMKKDDPHAYNVLALHYEHGNFGLPKEPRKTKQLWLKAGELGCARAYGNLADAYEKGEGVGVHVEKARYYYELSAMMGDEGSRHNLGCYEEMTGNIDRAIKHWKISASSGADKSLELLRRYVTRGDMMKDDYEKILRAHNHFVNGMKSEQREKATQLRKQGLGGSTPLDSPL